MIPKKEFADHACWLPPSNEIFNKEMLLTKLILRKLFLGEKKLK